MKMHSFLLCLYLPLVCCVAVNNMKSLTESMGQEVIEMDAPIKELPPEIEEEPSAENDGEVKSITTTLPPSTKNFAAKETRRRMKETDRTQSKQEEEEARIEKELSDLYKDSADYKADSAEVTKEQIGSTSSTIQAVTEDGGLKAIARAREEFKFQPESNNRADVERFRTSVDVISCDKKRLTGVTIEPLSSGYRATCVFNGLFLAAIIMRSVLCF